MNHAGTDFKMILTRIGKIIEIQQCVKFADNA
jgi:hypothetical protein